METVRYLAEYIKRSNKAFKEIKLLEGQSILWSWIDSVWCFIRYGCTIRQYSAGGGKFYKYSNCLRNNILTTRRFFKIVKKANNQDYVKYLENKLLFNEKFKPFVRRKWYDSQSISLLKLKELLESPNGLIVKPLDGMEGHGVFKLTQGCIKNIEDIYNKIRQYHYIIEECLTQHAQMRFGNESVNTIRVITVWDEKNKVSHIVKAVLRAGVGTSVVDNFHQGGCAYEVDLTSGIICSKGISMYDDKILFHPGTDICMLGYKIPNWNTVIDGCLKAQTMLPECKYISWDVAIVDNGIELIEGNHNGDYDMLEFIGSIGYYKVLKHYLL